MTASEEKAKEHVHDRSVFTRCLSCDAWGINLPGEMACGNCGGTDTVLYSPPCCLHAARKEQAEKDAELCMDERVDFESTKAEVDDAYNAACGHCSEAIRQEAGIEGERCPHGVWKGDHCWSCEKEEKERGKQ